MHRLARRIFCIARAVATRESGNTTVEFLLLAALLALGSIAGAQSLALSLNNAYEQVATNFSNAITPNLSGAAGASGSGAGSGSGSGTAGGGRSGGPGPGRGSGNKGGGGKGSGGKGSGGNHGRP